MARSEGPAKCCQRHPGCPHRRPTASAGGGGERVRYARWHHGILGPDGNRTGPFEPGLPFGLQRVHDNCLAAAVGQTGIPGGGACRWPSGCKHAGRFACPWLVATVGPPVPPGLGVLTTSRSTPGVFFPALTCVTLRTLIRVFEQLLSMSFCSDRTVRLSPAWTPRRCAVKNREPTSGVSASRRHPSRSVGSVCWLASNLPLVSGPHNPLRALHQTHVSRLSARVSPRIWPYPAGYGERHPDRPGSLCLGLIRPRSDRLYGRRPSLLGSSSSRWGFVRPLRFADCRCRQTPSGLPCSA